MSAHEKMFRSQWPDGLKVNKSYSVLCDDKGRNGGSFLTIFVAEDGDVHVSMQDWEDIPEGSPSSMPCIRIRTSIGGGRNWRTRQALLWLAQAMRLDADERHLTTAAKPQRDGNES